MTPNAVTIQWRAPDTRSSRVVTAEPKYIIQFRTKYTDSDNDEWSERGEDEIERQLTYRLTGLLPYSYYEARVVPYSQFGQGTPSQPVDFRTDETG